jgi:selenocysteine lyase/cysteine desulfurase
VVVTDLAFMSSTYPWLVSQTAVEDLRFIESRDGKIDLEELAARVDANTAAVSICAVTVGSGYRFDLAAVHEITSRHDVPLIVDAAQALGLVHIDVNHPPLDFVACTASKWLMGPAGVGYRYVSDRHLHSPPPAVGWLAAANVGDWDVRHCELHQDAGRFQGGIPNFIGVVGAEAGLDLLEKIGRPFIERRVRELTMYLLEQLETIGVDIWTPRADQERAGIVFFRVPNHEALHTRLKEERIYCGAFLGGIRVDPNFYNTVEELDKFLAVVKAHVSNTD